MIGSTNARTLQAKGGLFNFPLTIAADAPTAEDAIKSGHIWIIENEYTANITNIYIADAVTVDMPNGSLILQVSDISNVRMDVSEEFKLAAPVVKYPLAYNMDNISDDYTEWLVGSNAERSVYLDKPKAYVKYNDTIYVVTAYFWDGEAWRMISVIDGYLFLPLGYRIWTGSTYSNPAPVRVYNRIQPTEFSEHSELVPYESHVEYVATASRDTGEFIAYGPRAGIATQIYKRTGDEFMLFQTIEAADLVSFCADNGLGDEEYLGVGAAGCARERIKLSPDGKYLAMLIMLTDSSTASSTTTMSRLVIVLLENNGVSYVCKQIIFATSKSYVGFGANHSSYTSGATRTYPLDWDISDDMTVAAVFYSHRTVYGYANTIPNNIHVDILVGAPGMTYTDISSKVADQLDDSDYYCSNVAVSPKGSYVVVPNIDIISHLCMCVYKIDKDAQTASKMKSIGTSSTYTGIEYYTVMNNPTSWTSLKNLIATEKAFYFIMGTSTSTTTKEQARLMSVPIDIDSETFAYLPTTIDLYGTSNSIAYYQYVNGGTSTPSNLVCNVAYDFVNEVMFVCTLGGCAVHKITMSANGAITKMSFVSLIASYGLNTQYGNAIVVPST